MNININCKSIAQKKCNIAFVPYEYDSVPLTTYDFIRDTVKITIKKYINRKESSNLIKILTSDDINNKASQGKVSFDQIYNDNDINVDLAIDNAIQCFLDGIFLIFVDEKQLEDINEDPCLHDNSEVTFIRMTMLSGRMW